MEKFTGVLGIVVILGIAYLLSNNRKAINYRLVGSGLAIQLLLAFFILKTDTGKYIFGQLGAFITAILEFSNKGAEFVFGVMADKEALEKTFGAGRGVIFFFRIMPTFFFVAALVSIAYHIGLMQRIVSFFARIVYMLMGVSGSEALSNVASAFVGQVEAQIMIQPYLKGMTKSELLASMAGSMACIAGGVMAVYISFGVDASYLIAASIMAAPAALVIAKIVYPETEQSETRGLVQLEIKQQHANLIDAISHGAGDGLKVGLNVFAMLIVFISLVAMLDAGLGLLGKGLIEIGLTESTVGYDLSQLSMKRVFGVLFAGFSFLMGVPLKDCIEAGGLLGTKFVLNEFVAYLDLTAAMKAHTLAPKSVAILSIALCGFANLGSIGIQVGGIGQLAPERRADIATLGFRALICGTLASYLSACIAGILF